jgi:drug/metabolite transporter (DMT)-like permease
MVYLIVLIGIFSCSFSQLLLKKSAGKKHRSGIFEMLNPLVLFSYAIFFVVLVVNIWALSRGLQLKELALLESLGYIFVPLLSWLVLKEQITKRTILAILMIISGIIVFYL